MTQPKRVIVRVCLRRVLVLAQPKRVVVRIGLSGVLVLLLPKGKAIRPVKVAQPGRLICCVAVISRIRHAKIVVQPGLRIA